MRFGGHLHHQHAAADPTPQVSGVRDEVQECGRRQEAIGKRQKGKGNKATETLDRGLYEEIAMGELWLCGQFRAETEQGNVWDFQGVFTTREKAVQACRHRRYFIAPVLLNTEYDDKACVNWPGQEYPLAEKAEDVDEPASETADAANAAGTDSP